MRPRPIEPARTNISVSVVDGMGQGLRTFMQGGQTFVLGNPGQRYGVRIHNSGNERVEVVLSVDGRDAVNGEQSNMQRDRGYLVPAMGSVTIDGFRTSLESVASFRFSDPSDSFAGQMGDMRSIGVIRVAAFRERAAALAVPMRPMTRRSADAGASESRQAPRASKADRFGAVRPRMNNLGTEFGEERDSHVMEVAFTRASNTANQVVVLRYDDAQGLEARGIDVDPMMRRDRMMRRPAVSLGPDQPRTRRFAMRPRRRQLGR